MEGAMERGERERQKESHGLLQRDEEVLVVAAEKEKTIVAACCKERHSGDAVEHGRCDKIAFGRDSG